MYYIDERISATGAPDDRLIAPFELRQKSRARVTLASGVEAGLFLGRGTGLRHGDCLRSRCGRVVRVEAVRNTRSIGKADMIHNAALPVIEVDPQNYQVRADGVLLTLSLIHI